MNITVVASGIPSTQYPINGIFEFGQAKALAATGHKVTFLAFDFRPINIKRKYGVIRQTIDGIETYTLSIPTGVYRRCLSLLQYLALKMFRKIEAEQGRQDIINAHFYSIGAICGKIPLKTCARLVVTEHSSKLNKPLAEISQLDRSVAVKAYKNASAVIAVSQTLADRLKENFDISAVIIGDMVDYEVFSKVNLVNHNGFNILSVGRLIKGKGMDKLIKAFHLFSKSTPDTNLTIIGSGAEQENLHTLCANLGIADKVKFIGSADHSVIAKHLSQSNVFALLSERETFGVSYAEALTAGVAVIATRCGGPEGFIDNTNGVLVNQYNCIDETSEAFSKISSGALSFKEEEIRKSALNFSPLTIAEKIISTFQQVLQ